MAYFPDRRTIIVVKAEHAAQANQLAQVATRNPDGTDTTDLNTFSTALRLKGGATTVAYIANWPMTEAHRTSVLSELGNRFQRAVNPIPLGGRTKAGDPFWIFNAEPGQWDGDSVMAALGMEPNVYVEE